MEELKFEPNIQVSLFAGKSPKLVKHTDLFKIAKKIKECETLARQTQEYRDTLDEYGKKDDRTISKKHEFPMFTPNGRFTYKDTQHYIDGTYTSVCPFDIDLDDNPGIDWEATRQMIELDEHVIFLMESSSRGLKGLLAFDYKYQDPDTWRDMLLEIVYPVLSNRWGVKLDKNQAPFSQGMWFSHDPYVHVNLTPIPYTPNTELRPIPDYKPNIKFNSDYQSIQRFLDALSEAESKEVFTTIKKTIPILARLYKGGTLDLTEAQILDLAIKAVIKAPGTDNPKKAETQVTSAWKNALRQYEAITQDHLARKEFLNTVKFWIKTGWTDSELPYALVGSHIIYQVQKTINGNEYVTRERSTKEAISLRVNGDNNMKNHILSTMPKCDTFVWEPDFINYQKIIDNCYNVCWPLSIKPVKGPWPTIEKSLRHSFTSSVDWKGLNGYDFQLDWECLLIRHPKEKLPGLIWKSTVHGRAGKTELFKRLLKMLGKNTAKVRMSDMTNNFNGSYADKCLTVIDETEYGDFKQNESLNSLFKNIIDGETITVEYKGLEAKTLPNHNHILLVSNKDKPIPIESEDKRWHVVDMPLYPEDEIDPLISKKFEEELPHYLHYLLFEHELKFKRESRLWFNEEIFNTPAKRSIQDQSKGQIYQAFLDALVDYFMTNPKEKSKKFTMDSLKSFLDLHEISWYKNTKALKEMMKNEMGVEMKAIREGDQVKKGWRISRDHPSITQEIEKILEQDNEERIPKVTDPEDVTLRKTKPNVFDLDGLL